MANSIILKRSATPGKVPTTSQLALGEIAINTHDGLLYIKKDDGTPSVVQIGGVTSVNGKTGAAVINTGDLAESGNLFFTNARARSALSAGSGISYNSTTGVISTVQGLSTTSSPTFAGLTLTGNVSMTGDIIPTANNVYSLGSPTMQWKDVYVGPGSLYVDGIEVIHSTGDSMNFTSDADQNMRITTTGAGVLQLGSSTTNVNIDGTLQIASGKNITDSAGVQVNFGDNIQMNNNKVVGLGAPSASTDAATKGYVDTQVASISTSTISQGNSSVAVVDTGTGVVNVTVDGSTALSVTSTGVVVAGNFTVQGTTTTVESNTVSVADNILTLNSDVTGVPTQNAGIEVERGDEANVQLRWNEAGLKWTFTNDGAVYYPMAVSTTDLAEGTNQYFTTARARSAISASSASGVSYNSSTGTISLGSIPNSSLTNSSITINGVATALGGTRTLGSDDVAEGSTNLYFTTARARNSISAGTGISYNSTTGAISTSAIPNASLANSSVTVGTTAIALGASSTTLAGLTSVTSTSFTGDLTGNASTATKLATARTISLSGDVTGSVSFDGSANASITATIAANSVALGTDTTGDYVSSLVAGTGITLSNNAGEGATPTVAVDTTTIATKSYVDTAVAGKDNTDEITEGTTNLYFTNARARSAISVSGSLSYNSATGVISYTTPSTSGITEGTNLYYTDTRARAALSGTSGISYDSATGIITNSDRGSSQNIFKNFTDGTVTAAADSNTDTFKFRGANGVTVSVGSDDATHGDNLLIGLSSVPNSSLANSSITVNGTSISLGGTGSFGTDSVTEGATNLYFTTSRARSSVSAGTGISYSSSTGVISTSAIPNSSLSNSSITINGVATSLGGTRTLGTDDVAEGTTNKYYTDARARAAISAGTGISYNSSTGVISAGASLATTSYVDTAISNLVGGASAAYDTLKEIQDAMATDAELSAAIAAITIGNGTQTITAGSYLTGGGSFTANQTSSSSVTLAVDATSANTASKVVARDASGNFSAGTITATLSGNASTASAWATGRTITLAGDLTGSVTIDGSANATLTATVAANSVALGTDTTGNYMVDVSAGTGISVSHTQGEGSTATVSIDSSVVTLTGTQTLTNKTLTSPTITGTGTIAAASVTLDGVVLQDTATLTTSATTAGQVVASLSATAYRTVEFTVSATSGSAYHATKILAIHDGTTVSLVQYGEITTGSSLATFDADISGGNIRLLTTPTNAVTTYKVSVTAIAA